MGIHGLNPIIKKCNKNVYKTCDYRDFEGKTLAMDVSIFLHKYIHSDRKTWFSQLVMFFVKMKRANIDIVAVFDGEHVPFEKQLEREQRKISSVKSKDRLEEIKQLQQLILTLYINSVNNIEVSKEHQASVLNLLPKNTKIDVSDPECCLNELKALEERVENQNARVDNEIVQASHDLVECLGIPNVTAYGEAEALCASLAIHGYVDGVLSRDTDTLVYGAPLFVNDFKDNKFSWTTFEEVLYSLQLTQSEFIDFCIMCGCDYNSNMEKIAAGKAYSYISKYGSIENFEANEEADTTCLRYKRCREIFVPYSKEYLEGYLKQLKEKKLDEHKMKQLFQNQGCNITYFYIKGIWSKSALNKIEFVE